uniref:Uncharacterized protein n=1 Tax=Arundo donax TaxID=35708 RepID=A0A0A9H473_ARUDO
MSLVFISLVIVKRTHVPPIVMFCASLFFIINFPILGLQKILCI